MKPRRPQSRNNHNNHIGEGTPRGARRTWNSTEWPTSADSVGRTRIRHRCAKGFMILDRSTGPGSLPLAHFPLHTMERRGVQPCHKLITPSKMDSPVRGLLAAPCPHAYEHRQSCPGVTQAESRTTPASGRARLRPIRLRPAGLIRVWPIANST